MSEMVDRVARAIQHMHDTGPKQHFQSFARAAIEAMREPTPDMNDAVLASMDWIKDEKQRQAHTETQKEQWRTMIDAALKEEPSAS